MRIIEIVDLLASVGELHKERSDDDIWRQVGCTFTAAADRRLLAQLRVLEQDVLVQLDPALQDLQKNIQRVVGERRLDHVEQRFVLDEPLLDFALFQRQEALVRGGNRRRPVGYGATHLFFLLVRQVQFLTISISNISFFFGLFSKSFDYKYAYGFLKKKSNGTVEYFIKNSYKKCMK